ncbi:hypothetical protein [Peribacillus loiseleuriae]|uniref:hypothetical protein n=1 Tax=Peribacillus loiseleuriae TaxID=1679170 RepID=UPI000AD019FA|nr:hypothetical protein [Peribacillus loiseleuriae]
MGTQYDLKSANRPYIVCHMMTSLNGKITGPFMKLPEIRLADQEYERTNATYQPHA